MNKNFLSISNLTKSFGGELALSDVSFSMQCNEILALVGPNGAGKTTLAELISGALRPTSGTIHFREHLMNHMPEYLRVRKGIVRKHQMPQLFDDLSVKENLKVASSFVQAADGLDINDVAKRTRLDRLMMEPAGSLSGGQRQWLDLAMALMTIPKLVLLDEPTAGITAEDLIYMRDIIKSIALSSSVIIIEHNLGFLNDFQCRCLILNSGVIKKDTNIREVITAPLKFIHE